MYKYIISSSIFFQLPVIISASFWMNHHGLWLRQRATAYDSAMAIAVAKDDAAYRALPTEASAVAAGWWRLDGSNRKL